MHTIGLLGTEYDACLRLLKVRIEDLGHSARVINLAHLPRVTRATVELDRLVCDGWDLFEFGSFYLKEMGIREAFFHVSYDRDFWDLLRERYLAFYEGEQESVLFACGLVEILAARVPVINHPRSYARRALMPLHLNALARRGLRVPAFTTSFTNERAEPAAGQRIPLNLDIERTCDAWCFPKGTEAAPAIWRERKPGVTYRLIVIGERLHGRGLACASGEEPPRVVDARELDPLIGQEALKAARAAEITFGEVELLQAEEDGVPWLLQVDPSPDFSVLETRHGLEVSRELAEYMVAAAAENRTQGGSQWL